MDGIYKFGVCILAFAGIIFMVLSLAKVRSNIRQMKGFYIGGDLRSPKKSGFSSDFDMYVSGGLYTGIYSVHF